MVSHSETTRTPRDTNPGSIPACCQCTKQDPWAFNWNISLKKRNKQQHFTDNTRLRKRPTAAAPGTRSEHEVQRVWRNGDRRVSVLSVHPGFEVTRVASNSKKKKHAQQQTLNKLKRKTSVPSSLPLALAADGVKSRGQQERKRKKNVKITQPHTHWKKPVLHFRRKKKKNVFLASLYPTILSILSLLPK